MIKIIHGSILIMGLVTFLLSFSIAQAETTTADTKKTLKTEDGFSISIPKEWTQIPKEIIDQFSEDAHKAKPSEPKQNFDYAFQATPSGSWFKYPYLLIQVHKTGRLPDGLIQSIKKQADSDVNEFKKDSSFFLSANVQKSIYEESTNTLWNVTNYTLDGGIQVRAFIATIHTENGSIQIMGYSKTDELRQYAPIFDSIFKNIVVDDSLRYKPRLSEVKKVDGIGVEWAYLKKIVGAAAVGAFLVLIGYKRKKTKVDSASSDKSPASEATKKCPACAEP
jgi:hypothetical protein